MKTNREKFLELVSDVDIKAEERINWRIANRPWLRVSQGIAFDILEKLDDLGWTQKDLAEKMGVSPPYINKIVKGSENFTLESLVKLQEILDIPILASYSKKKATTPNYDELTYGNSIEDFSVSPSLAVKTKYSPVKVVKMQSKTSHQYQKVM
jgi:ribosome-binding protein aMBF1 (putative translation factor)